MASISDIIRAAAARYGVDPETMLRTAQIESTMNPAAANPRSSARGLFQFITPTWQQYGGGADPLDPEASADAAARFTRDNIGTFQNRLGRAPTPAETYLMHQQGPAGAISLLRDPNAPASAAVGPKAIQYNGGDPMMTAGDFAAKWTGKFDGTQPVAETPMMPIPGRDTLAPADLVPGRQGGVDLAPLMAVFARAAETQAPQRRRPFSLERVLQPTFVG